MSLDLEVAETANASVVRARAERRPSLDAVEWGVLAVFAVLSLWTVGVDLWRAHADGLVWTHTDGLYIVDQMQYLAWIRSASVHGLVANLFVLHGTPADYFQPAVLLSAGLVRLGMASWLALLLWKPVAVLATFVAYRWYVRATLDGRTARRVGLVLALFYGCFSIVYGSWSVIGDLMPVFLTWGYTFGLVAIALMIIALLVYERTRERPRASVVPGALGAIAGLLHPWQGELMIILVLGTEAVLWCWTRRRPRHPLRTPAMTIVLTGLPLLYYEVLGRADPSWTAARVASKHAFSLWSILIALAPLVVLAVWAWRPSRLTFLHVLTRVWILAAVVIWLLSATALSATPLHAFQGITLPLAILAVEGAGRLRLAGRLPRPRAVLAVALLLVTVPATVKLFLIADHLAGPTTGNGNFIHPEDRRALAYLEHDPTPGGVLARAYLGSTVPALTGRRTLVGDCLWSEPYCNARSHATQNLTDGRLSVAQGRQLVLASRARFVVTDCEQPADLRRTLRPFLLAVHSFGCAAVYELRPPTPVSPAVAESRLDAALRATGRK